MSQSLARARWLEPTGLVRHGLRRTRYGCGQSPDGRHDAISWPGGLGQANIVQLVPSVFRDYNVLAAQPTTPFEDSDWPERCQHCTTYKFKYNDGAYVDMSYLVYSNGDDMYLLAEPWMTNAPERIAPDGSMWNGSWYLPAEWRGEDGRCVVIRCPGGGIFIPDKPAHVQIVPRYPDAKYAGRVVAGKLTYRWTRTTGLDVERGRITVNPEIEVGDRGKPGYFYGRLTNGEFWSTE